MVFGLFQRRDAPTPSTTERVYGLIVAQARAPIFYRELGVPDTVMGRYEMIVLHAFLYFHRLKAAEPAAKDAAQDVFDLMFSETDSALREIGVGDLTVPKRIKSMAGVFYARAAAYDAALTSADDADLIAALAAGPFEGADAPGARPLARYLRLSVEALAAQSVSALVQSGPAFPQAEASS
ncbi:ubiquinol-cytochrome C chaperone family protein [Methylopila sp. Yamaguchi]|uniref:ubiquinol-cytochrome C chaperone family protein n=1 Tax=Methylopila sp. Yamaguchi TaxID=1437817 RepID=UPI000CAE7880|nr:ubiquinol-cytochrome C chaperone family protein [Methylopila sp. Yamaguchi]GBD48624.1 ubiquinol-cytochrome c reductase complex chaperone CBP3 [Methylopila sp. Yamaguchi]